MHLGAAGYLHVQGRPSTLFGTYKLAPSIKAVFTPSLTMTDAQAFREIR